MAKQRKQAGNLADNPEALRRLGQKDLLRLSELVNQPGALNQEQKERWERQIEILQKAIDPSIKDPKTLRDRVGFIRGRIGELEKTIKINQNQSKLETKLQQAQGRQAWFDSHKQPAAQNTQTREAKAVSQDSPTLAAQSTSTQKRETSPETLAELRQMEVPSALSKRKNKLFAECDSLSDQAAALKGSIPKKAMEGIERLVQEEKAQISKAGANEIRDIEIALPTMLDRMRENVATTIKSPEDEGVVKFWAALASEEDALQTCDALSQQVQTASKKKQIPEEVSVPYLEKIEELREDVRLAGPEDSTKIQALTRKLQDLQADITQTIKASVTELQQNAEFQKQEAARAQQAAWDEARSEAENTVVPPSPPAKPTLSTSIKAAIGLSALAAGGATSGLVYKYGTQNIDAVAGAGVGALSVTFAVLLVVALASTLSKSAPDKFTGRDIFGKENADFSMEPARDTPFPGSVVQ